MGVHALKGLRPLGDFRFAPVTCPACPSVRPAEKDEEQYSGDLEEATCVKMGGVEEHIEGRAGICEDT